jgi:hypothetical protein
MLLLSDRREDAKLTIPELENGFVGIAVIVPDLDAMEPLNRDRSRRRDRFDDRLETD